MQQGALGIVQLQNAPLQAAGTLGNPGTFPFPIVYDTACGAWVDRVTDGDPDLAPAYASAAARLVARGATAIMTNCGFAFGYSKAMTAAVSVPVGTSPLELLPVADRWVRPGGSLVVLTFDARKLDLNRLASLAAPDVLQRVTIVGIEGTPAHDALRSPTPEVTPSELITEAENALGRVLIDDTSVLVVECSAFCPMTATLRRRLGIPVLDFCTLASILMDVSTSPHPLGR